MAHAVAAPRADRRKSTLLNIHKSPVDVVVVVAGAALLEPSIRNVATDVVPMIQVIPGSDVSSISCLFFVVHKRTRSFRVRSVVRLQAVEVDERFVVSQPRAQEE